jgi:hypothetical protein
MCWQRHRTMVDQPLSYYSGCRKNKVDVLTTLIQADLLTTAQDHRGSPKGTGPLSHYSGCPKIKVDVLTMAQVHHPLTTVTLFTLPIEHGWCVDEWYVFWLAENKATLIMTANDTSQCITEDHCQQHRAGPSLTAQRTISGGIISYQSYQINWMKIGPLSMAAIEKGIGSPITLHKLNLWAKSEGWWRIDWSHQQQSPPL